MSEELVHFEEFELSRGAFELRRKGRTVRLERIPLELLFLLVERRGLLVGREEILERVWGKDVFVDTDNSINTAVWKIRQALGDDPENPRFVQTVPGKGYRFAAKIVTEEPASATSRGANEPKTEGAGSGTKQHTRKPGLWLGFGAAVLLATGAAAFFFLRHTGKPAPARAVLVALLL